VNSAALDRVFRDASGRIVAALASRFRHIDLAEDSFADACEKAVEVWQRDGVPNDPAAWLYRTAFRCAIDALRRHRTEARYASHVQPENGNDDSIDDEILIPDERLRLVFICCHPAVAIEARAALTLRLICGLTAREIARAFIIPEATLAQRLIRAKRKIAEAGIPFEVPGPDAWPERLDAVLSTVEVAYSKAHEDAAGSGPYAGFAAEMLELTRVLAELLNNEPEALALSAIIRFAEARRPARVDSQGMMIPISEQDPARWNHALIEEASHYLKRAIELHSDQPRVIQACIHATWCSRQDLTNPAPWHAILTLYDALLEVRDDAIVRLNRAVALAEVSGVNEALDELNSLATGLKEFPPFYAVRADLLRRAGKIEEAISAYDIALALVPTSAERRWLEKKKTDMMLNK